MKVKIWKVSQINSYIRGIIDGDILLNSFFAEGEISNFKIHTAGHIYFTLKDEKSSINCVMFKTYAESVTFDLVNGTKIIVCGYISVYEKTGQIQLYVELIEPLGKGRQYAAFEQLKLKLKNEGLFDEDKKKKIPAYPKCVGVITSGTGAAVRDIINVIKRRNPNVKIVVLPVLVQGENAPAEIISAIKDINVWEKADVVILGRGGGSAEDLWAFNDESVARSIYNSSIPIISAVGHETDFTIADLAADLRAPTPSSAAELAVPDLISVKNYYFDLRDSMADCLNGKIIYARERLNHILNRNVMQNPHEIISIKRKTVIDLYKTINKEIEHKLTISRNRLHSELKSLENISPLKVISRGYVLARDKKGSVVTNVNNIEINDRIQFQFRDGYTVATINEKRLGDSDGEEKNGL